MDPASVAGLIVLAGQIASSIYKYGIGVRNARKEIDQLCIDLFALKGTLEHVRLHIESCKAIDADVDSSSTFSLASQIFSTDEFNGMISSTDTLLRDLYELLEKAPDRRRNIIQHLMWPLTKGEVQEYMDRLEKLKSYFILAITSDNLEVSKQIYFEVHALGQIVRRQQEEHQEKAADKYRKAVSQWLAPYDSIELHQKALEARQPGTGRWFLSNSFRDWSQTRLPQILWLRGRPGVGKTSLFSAAIEDLQQQVTYSSGNICLAHFYCSFTDQLSQDPKNILGSLIKQICNAQPSLWEAIDGRYHMQNSKGQGVSRSLQLSSLQQILNYVCTSFDKLYLFIDAPNESSESTMIMSALWALAKENRCVKIMISSTEEVVQVSPWNLECDDIFTISMDSKETQQDIHDYVEANLKQDHRLRPLPTELKDDIKSSLVNKSDGVFRWVECQLQTLVDQKTPKGIRRALDSIPQSLEKTYCNILLRIPESDQAIAKRVLLWLTFAVRTLQLNELSEAVVVEDDSTTIDENDRLLHPTDLLRICRGLISFNPSTNHVTLAHSSVQAYLTSFEIKSSPASYFFLHPATAHSMLMRKCLTYLYFNDFRDGYSENPEGLPNLSSRWPLLDYCVGSWPAHARYLRSETELDHDLREVLLRFFATARQPRNGNFGSWIQQYLPEADRRIVQSPPLYYAARFGLLSVVRTILAVEGTSNLESVGGRRDSTPLHVASAYGHTDVVEVLLAAGANARAINSKGRIGLLTAAENGETEIVRMLLSAGADPNHRTAAGRTPLYLAIVNQEVECIQLLKQAGAETDDVDGARTSADELEEIVRQIVPDATPGQVRFAREPDQRSGTNPRARGELPTVRDKETRKKLAQRLRIFSQAKISKERLAIPKDQNLFQEDLNAGPDSTPKVVGQPHSPPISPENLPFSVEY